MAAAAKTPNEAITIVIIEVVATAAVICDHCHFDYNHLD
jgi:hypothetical protein